MVTTLLARVAGLVLFLFGLGVFSQTGYLLIVTLLFGGDASAVAPLLVLTLKVATVSLASVTVFSRIGSGPSVQRADVVRMPGAVIFLDLLCLSDASHADGGIPECDAFLPTSGKSAGTRYIRGKDSLSRISGSDHHPCLLSADAEYSQAQPDDSGGSGN